MRSEYDETALTLMRAIKAGVDPKGIMNPGTLLPPVQHGTKLPPRTATIDFENVAGWVVRPENLSAPAETEPPLKTVVPPVVKGQEAGGSRTSLLVGKVPSLGGLFGKGVEARDEIEVPAREDGLKGQGEE